MTGVDFARWTNAQKRVVHGGFVEEGALFIREERVRHPKLVLVVDAHLKFYPLSQHLLLRPPRDYRYIDAHESPDADLAMFVASKNPR